MSKPSFRRSLGLLFVYSRSHFSRSYISLHHPTKHTSQPCSDGVCPFLQVCLLIPFIASRRCWLLVDLSSHEYENTNLMRKTVDLLHRGGEPQLRAIPPLSFSSSAAWPQLRNYFSFDGLIHIPFPLSEVALTCCFEFRSINLKFQRLRVTEYLNRENGMSRLLFPSITLILLDTTVRRKHFRESNTEPGWTNIGQRCTEHSETQAQDVNTTLLEP